MQATTSLTFPSLAWFEALRERMNTSPAKYRDLGYADSRAIFRVLPDNPGGMPRAFVLVFDVYECTEVMELRVGEAFDADWELEAPLTAWREMLENIKAHSGADSQHTLNRLSLLQHPFKITGADQTRVDLFFRQQLTFQEFINDSQLIATRFS